MALPKLNSAPKYEIVVPSTGKKVRYRPYLVKEEKILMIAMESQDQKQALSAIVDTIQSCVQEDIDGKALTTFDVEYLFTQIRSKSVGETAKLNLKCEHCEETTEVAVKLDDIQVQQESVDNNIQLTDDISLKMRWPTYLEVMETSTNENDNVDMTFSLIKQCIDSVLTNEEAIRLKDEPKEEVDAFLESLSSSQFDKIRQYVEKMPKMEHQVSFTCSHCEKGNDITLSGISDFF